MQATILPLVRAVKSRRNATGILARQYKVVDVLEPATLRGCSQLPELAFLVHKIDLGGVALSNTVSFDFQGGR